MHLEQAIRALDDLHPRLHRRALERDIGQLVDGDPGRDLEEQGRLFLERHEALAHCLEKPRDLRLERIQDSKGA
jgi:hypothetical protein